MQGKMKRLQGNLDKHLQTIGQARRFLRSSIENTVEKLCGQNGVILQNIADYKLSQRRAMVGLLYLCWICFESLNLIRRNFPSRNQNFTYCVSIELCVR